VAQRIDNDPLVLVHARALLVSSPEGKTNYVDADMRDPDAILSAPELLETLDLSKPVGLTLVAILHFIEDKYDPYAIIARLMAALAPGSMLAVVHSTTDHWPPQLVQDIADGKFSEGPHDVFVPRPRASIARFFDSLELVAPGLVPVAEWRDDRPESERPKAEEVCMYSGIGVKR
jgi:trans-aconitate methyltransferase